VAAHELNKTTTVAMRARLSNNFFMLFKKFWAPVAMQGRTGQQLIKEIPEENGG
jgi:hypothetical protein